MAAPVEKICYLAALGDEAKYLGTCPGCKGKGKVGNFCYLCCKAAGMIMGVCGFPDCDYKGPIGLLCQGCGDGEYAEPPPYDDSIPDGICPLCQHVGWRHTFCSRCEDCSILYD
jgi:hypothetical protein